MTATTWPSATVALQLNSSSLHLHADPGRRLAVVDPTGGSTLVTLRANRGGFVEGRHLFQDEVHIRGLLFDGLIRQARDLRDWANRSDVELARWVDIEADRGARDRALERMRGYLRQRLESRS